METICQPKKDIPTKSYVNTLIVSGNETRSRAKDITINTVQSLKNETLSDIIETNRRKNKEKCKLWRINNKERIKQYLETNEKRIKIRSYHYNKFKLNNDLNYRIAFNLRCRIRSAVKTNVKAGSAVRDLGCSISEFKQYIEKKFERGMSWSNHGEWHMDHIKPLASFDLTNRKEFLIASNYTNYQPLWAKDNIRKSDKIV
jgi:hypothetical protein